MVAKRKPPEPDAPELSEEHAASRSFWSGTITFGLVSIPVDFHTAHRPRLANLRLVTKDGHPVGRRYVCSRHRRPVPEQELVRAYELESGEFVVVSDEELEAVAPEKTRDIELERFVAESELEPLLFTRTYVLAPAGESAKAYRLLAETMERSGQAGIATFVMREKAYVVAILSKGGVLRAQTLRFSDELRSPESIGLPSPVQVPRARLKQLLNAVDELSREEVELEELTDQYGESLVRLAEKKAQKGQDVVLVDQEADSESEAPAADIIDLVALLKERLEARGQ